VDIPVSCDYASPGYHAQGWRRRQGQILVQGWRIGGTSVVSEARLYEFLDRVGASLVDVTMTLAPTRTASRKCLQAKIATRFMLGLIKCA